MQNIQSKYQNKTTVNNSRNDLNRKIPLGLLKQLFSNYRKIRSRSINTKKNQHCILRDIAEILNRNFHLQKISNLQQKHVVKIIEEWKDRGYKPGTLTTKVGFLRKLCFAIGKKSCIKNNKFYGIKRGKVKFTDKRWTPNGRDDLNIINKVDNSLHKYGNRIKDCLTLERNFGLRKREALRFYPYKEIKTDEEGIPVRIELTLGTKNNRYRTIPVGTNEQKSFLKYLLKKYELDLIQPRAIQQYKKWERIYYYVLDKLGIKHSSTGHGLRQAYANDRIKAILKKVSDYSIKNNINISTEKKYEIVCEELSEELGHSRIDILKSYLADYKKQYKRT